MKIKEKAKHKTVVIGGGCGPNNCCIVTKQDVREAAAAFAL